MALLLDGTTFTLTVYAVRSMWKRIYYISFVTSLESNLTDLMAVQRRQAPGKYIYISTPNTQRYTRVLEHCALATAQVLHWSFHLRKTIFISTFSGDIVATTLCKFHFVEFPNFHLRTHLAHSLYILISTSNPLMHQITCLHGISNGHAMHRRCQLADEQLFTRSHVAPNTRPHHRPINRK